ncbi:MAG TPA: carboxypeptidase M32 [Gaiellaceae bacterium]|nr:carboxypeptidase M32 [Gaiellaceae bacterium]
MASDLLADLKARTETIGSLGAIGALLAWDLRTIMPPAGAAARGGHLGLVQQLGHEALIDPEMGRLLDELRPLEESLDPDSDDACLIRLVRRDYDKAVRVPTELSAEMARAGAEAAPIWLEAKMTANFELFLPALERAIELRRRYIACFDSTEEPYDILLDDFEPETKSADVTRIFDEIKAELVPMIAELREREVDDSFLSGEFPVDKQIELAHDIVDLFGHRPDTWRIDPTEHPFASGTGIDDIRITTHYYPDSLESLFSVMHEYGHGLYEHQIRRDIATLPIGSSSSLGIHESQSRLWENLVGRSEPFWRFFYPRLQEYFPARLGHVDRDAFLAGANKVEPSLIRIRADEVTYGMHVILRFELEQDIINGRVELSDLPRIWNERMEEYLGVEVPDDSQGVLQDVHWSAGLIGYFSTYLLGTVMSVQLWEKLNEDVADVDAQMERGEFGAIRDWLGDNVHASGRKFPPQETLRRAVGSTIDAKPYLAYLKRKYGVAVPA